MCVKYSLFSPLLSLTWLSHFLGRWMIFAAEVRTNWFQFAIIKRSCYKAPVVLRVGAGGNRYHPGALLSVRTCTDFVILLADGLFLDIVPAYPAFYSTWSPIHILDRVM